MTEKQEQALNALRDGYVGHIGMDKNGKVPLKKKGCDDIITSRIIISIFERKGIVKRVRVDDGSEVRLI